MEYIYILRTFSKESSCLKLGYTSNIQNRIFQYKSQNPLIEVLYIFEAENALEIEQEFHKNNISLLGKEWYEESCLEEMLDFLKSKKVENAITIPSIYNSTRKIVNNNLEVEINNLKGNKKTIPFKKYFPNGWKFLRKYLTSTELCVAYQLAEMSKQNTNSLSPLTDKTTIPTLEKTFGVSKNLIKPILKKLLDLGVYRRFDEEIPNLPFTKYWIFNPYLIVTNIFVYETVDGLFQDTHCSKASMNENYTLDDKTIKELKLKQNKKKESK